MPQKQAGEDMVTLNADAMDTKEGNWPCCRDSLSATPASWGNQPRSDSQEGAAIRLVKLPGKRKGE